MSIKRLPIAFLVVGLAFKTVLVLVWRLWQLPGLANLLVYYDPGARLFADKDNPIVFRLRGDYSGPRRACVLRSIPHHRLRH